MSLSIPSSSSLCNAITSSMMTSCYTTSSSSTTLTSLTSSSLSSMLSPSSTVCTKTSIRAIGTSASRCAIAPNGAPLHLEPVANNAYGASVTDITFPSTMVSPRLIRIFQPKELRRNRRFKRIPPDDISRTYQGILTSKRVKRNPSYILNAYSGYARKCGDRPCDAAFLVKAFCALADIFHPNSFFATSDKQNLKNFDQFKALCSDLADVKDDIPVKEIPRLLFAMASLEYRFWQIMPTVLDVLNANIEQYRFETLAQIIYSLAVLNIGGNGIEDNLVIGGRENVASAGGATSENGTTESDLYAKYKQMNDATYDVTKEDRLLSGCRFGPEEKLSRDYRGLFGKAVYHSGKFLPLDALRKLEMSNQNFKMQDGASSEESEYQNAVSAAQESIPPEEGHMWGQIMWSCVMMNHWDQNMGWMMAASSAIFTDRLSVDDSGWLGYFLYQTLYCSDVFKPRLPTAYCFNKYVDNERNTHSIEAGNQNTDSSETQGHAPDDSIHYPNLPNRNIEYEIKKGCPMWVQERLHESWLDGTLLKAQPQGSDSLQLDVEKALNRTNTQASINTSVGREFDDQHCFFAGHLMHPKIALEYDSASPMGPNRPRASGIISLKQRLFAKLGYQTATIHKIFWNALTDDQKDDQILRLRAQLGYLHQTQDRREGLKTPGLPNNDPNRPGAIKKRSDFYPSARPKLT